MNPTILRTNATSVYRFLSRLNAALGEGEHLRGKRILDCGAGSPIPPLAIFAEQGMEAHGIDISGPRLEQSRAFRERSGLALALAAGDMRQLPYGNEVFDYVYEHFSMCHLTKADTAVAVGEMRRVLRPGGSAFLGVVSQESWPLSSFGEERAPGERWSGEAGGERCHSLFEEAEADRLVADWEVTHKEKITVVGHPQDLSEAEWEALHAEAPAPCSRESWMARYPERDRLIRYVHTYYYLTKRNSLPGKP